MTVGGRTIGSAVKASIAGLNFDFVEMLDYDSAHIYSILMVTLSFVVLFCVYLFNYKHKAKYA